MIILPGYRRVRLALGMLVLVLFPIADLSIVLASSPVVIDDTFKLARLGFHLETLEDNGKKLTISDVSSPEYSGKFTPSAEANPNFGYAKSAIWARFRVKNSLKNEYTWFLEFPQPWVDHADLYIPEKSGYRVFRAGDMLPFDSREVRDRNFIFPVKQVPGVMTCYLRFETTSSLSLNLTMYSRESLGNKKEREIPLLWLYYGLLIAMIVYNLFVYVSIRDTSYLYYVFAISMLVMYLMSYNGTSFQYFWPDSIEWANRALSVFVQLTGIGFYLFTRAFLATRYRMPAWDRVILVFLFVQIVELIVVFILGPGKADGLAVYTNLFAVPLLMVIAGIAIRRGYRSAKIYIIAWSAFFLMAVIYMFRGLGLAPENILTHYSLHSGSVLAVILFSYGLADRINTMRDERMKAFEALNQSEEKYRNLVENINDVVYTMDNQGIITYISPTIEQFSMSYTSADIIGRSFIDFIHPDDLELVLKSRERTISGDPHYLEYRLLDKDGSIIYTRAFNRPTIRNGKLVGITGIINNITKQKEMIEALNASEEKYRTLIENTTESIYVTQGDNIKFMNRSALLVLGYTEEEVFATPFSEFIYPEDRKVMLDRYKRRLGGEDIPEFFQFRIIHRNGDVRWMEISAVKIKWEGKDAVLNFTTDITDRKKNEDRIRESLHEKELLLKEIHHRVKNNMQVISSLLNLQLNFVRDERDRAIFMDSQNRIRSMSLIHEKIYKSKDFVKIDFAEYIQDLAYSLYRTYNINQSMIRLAIRAENVYIGIDMAIPCGLIINELVSNSLKHAFPGGMAGEITIVLTSENGPRGGMHRLEVTDNGAGLSHELNPENPETLGLQLVSTLVKQLRGTLEIKNSNGTGFIISFPPAR